MSFHHGTVRQRLVALDVGQPQLLGSLGGEVPLDRAAIQVESLRILMRERHSAVKARSQTMNQIHALLITAPDEVKERLPHPDRPEPGEHTLRSRPAGRASPEPTAHQPSSASPVGTSCSRRRSR